VQTHISWRISKSLCWPYPRRIGKNPIDGIVLQQIPRLCRRPALVPRLDDDWSVVDVPYSLKRGIEYGGIER
jgi:hypothetical protein